MRRGNDVADVVNPYFERAEVVPALQFHIGEAVQENFHQALGAWFRGLRNGAAFADVRAVWLSSFHEKKNKPSVKVLEQSASIFHPINMTVTAG